MLLSQLFEASLPTLYNNLAIAKEELRAAKSASAGVQQGSSEAHQARVARAQAVVDGIKQDISTEMSRPGIEQEQRSSNQAIGQAQASETPDQRRERNNAAISDGQTNGNALRAKYGNEQGLADAIYKYVQTASNGGVDRVTAEDIAANFGDMTVRTINKWLERPAFRQTARLLGRR